MKFGDKSEFFISAEISRFNDVNFLSYAYVSNGASIGSIHQTCVLSSEKAVLGEILAGMGSRRNPFIESLPLDAAISVVIQNVWDYDFVLTGVSSVPYMPGELKALDLNSWSGECFAGFYVFLVEAAERDRLLWRDEIAGRNGENWLPSGYYYNCIRDMVAWIERSVC